MHILSDANGLPLVVGVSAANVHDSEGLKPMVEGHPTRHDPHNGRYSKPQRLHADKAYDRPTGRPRVRVGAGPRRPSMERIFAMFPTSGSLA